MRIPELSDEDYELLQQILMAEMDACMAAQQNTRLVHVNELIQKFQQARHPNTRRKRLLDSKP